MTIFFIQLYFLVGAAALLGLSLRWLRERDWSPVSPRVEARLHATLLVLCLALPFVPWERKTEFSLEPAGGGAGASVFREVERAVPEVRLPAEPAPVRAKENSWWPWLLLLTLVPPGRELWRLRRLLRSSSPWRSIGRVRLACSKQAAGPISARWGRTAWVVVPEALLLSPQNLRVVVAHELQHHRQRDTNWIYGYFFLRLLTPWHPLRALWWSAVERAQEEACDEALVDQKRVERRAYARCLLETANLCAGRGERVAGAANFFPFSGRNSLRRRIEKMYTEEKTKKSKQKMATWACTIVGGILLSLAAYGAKGIGSERVVTREMAEQMAVNARMQSSFPITVNEMVVAQLNRFLGTEAGRQFVREGLANMRGYEPILKSAIDLYGMPEEILAVGLAESGFRNLPPSANPVRAAGVWQFVASSARNFGLWVDEQVDERMDVALETDAAFRYLQANRLRYGHWLLGILAYNIGEQNLDRAIQEHRTRDPWELLRRGLRTDPNYLPKVMALVLILKNPDSLN